MHYIDDKNGQFLITVSFQFCRVQTRTPSRFVQRQAFHLDQVRVLETRAKMEGTLTADGQLPANLPALQLRGAGSPTAARRAAQGYVLVLCLFGSRGSTGRFPVEPVTVTSTASDAGK